MTGTHQMLVETQRVYDEYTQARAASEADPTDDLARGRYDRAQTALFELRQWWRTVGEATGNRTTTVTATDHEATPALLLTPQEA